ncbi:alpha/beta hydrolase [Sphingopyxis sp. R3-92]|uniref:alpha/beta hydrolase n=1 Tax=Sphingopyxis sp. R3-92 TaxID=3158553 RepID=UPI003EE5E4A5
MLTLATMLLPGTTLAQSPADGEAVISLYPEGTITPLGIAESRDTIPETGETMIFNVSHPTLELFRPAQGAANGTAVIIAPGGGFVGLGYEAGGTAVARELAKHGVTALVLKYRTIESPDDGMHMPEVHLKEMEAIMARAKSGVPAELPVFAGEQHAVEDGARAMAIVRQRAAEWSIDPERVGFLGFSSGAVLVADLAIGPKASRPDFVGMIYGGLRSPVPTDAAPAFIAAAADDDYLAGDSVQLFNAWRMVGAPAELHIYERGGHGFDLKPKGVTSDYWFEGFIRWIRSRGLLEPAR